MAATKHYKVRGEQNRKRSEQTPVAFRKPPSLFGQLIDLVNSLPRYDSIEFKLLHPSVTHAEVEWEFDAEFGVRRSPRFARKVDAMFRMSEETLTRGPKLGQFGELVSCGFWSIAGQALSEEFRETFGAGLYEEIKEDFLREHGTDRTARSVTAARAKRYGVSNLFNSVIYTKGYDAWKCATDLYEAFYALHDAAFLTETTLSFTRPSVLPRHMFSSTLRVDESGFLRESRSLFWEAIHEQNVEATRVRICKVCHRLFWAGRMSQKCCTPRCGNKFRVHRHRYKTETEKAEYMFRRMKREQERLKLAARPTRR